MWHDMYFILSFKTVFLYLHLSFHLSFLLVYAYVKIYLSIYLSIYWILFLSMSMSVYTISSIYLSIYSSIYLSFFLSIYLSIFFLAEHDRLTEVDFYHTSLRSPCRFSHFSFQGGSGHRFLFLVRHACHAAPRDVNMRDTVLMCQSLSKWCWT